jgi:uncharacterized protein (DUF1810 family)
LRSTRHAIFGSPNDLKYRSYATLFALAAGEQDNPFQRALDRWCNGGPNERTLLQLAMKLNKAPGSV